MNDLDRRHFLKTAAVAAAATAVAPAKTKTEAETVVASLYKSLNAEQKAKICFPFGHELQSVVDANWHITPTKIGDFFNRDQQAMVDEIFLKLHNPDFAANVVKHIEDDAGGLRAYSVALFGEPGTSKFEFVLTGRHCTARCDGDSVEGAAFGGPIFYGHQAGPSGTEEPAHPGNVYWYQAKRANEVFQSLSGKQREIALLSVAPRKEVKTKTVEIKPKGERFAGLPVSEMARDQRALVEKVLGDLLLPFRKKDTAEAMKMIKAKGGVDAMSMSFYKNLDLGDDGIWDVWQLESSNMVWYFRGYPHVHVWVNVRA